MIYHQISFENNNDKAIDYNLLLDTTYYTSPTLSTPLSSPTNSLIQDEMSMHQQQNVSSAPATTQQQGNYGFSQGNTSQPQQDDWLLGPFYDASTFTYNPLLPLDAPQGNNTVNSTALQQTSPIINHYTNQNFDNFPPVMVMNARSTDILAASGTEDILAQNHCFNQQQNMKCINEPVSAASTSPPPTALTKTKKKSSKKKPLPYAHQMRSLNFGYPAKTTRAYSSRASSSTASPPQPPPTSLSSSSSSSVTLSPSTTLYSAPTTSSISDKGKSKTKSASPYQCNYPGCQKSFTRPYNLKSHYRTHTNEKPFECPHCNKAFARQHDRNRHAKLHFGIKPYFCVYCYKAFARQDALTRHQTWVDESGVIGCSSLKRKSRKGSHPQ